jgi:hypothetical protein
LASDAREAVLERQQRARSQRPPLGQEDVSFRYVASPLDFKMLILRNDVAKAQLGFLDVLGSLALPYIPRSNLIFTDSCMGICKAYLCSDSRNGSCIPMLLHIHTRMTSSVLDTKSYGEKPIMRI